MKRAFSLIELLMAIFILGIGLVSIAALFPAGIALQQRSEDEFNGPIVADWAIGLLRDRLRADDFGTWWHFIEWNAQVDGEDRYEYEHEVREYLESVEAWHPGAWLQPEQWPWLRPALVNEADEPAMLGAIDIFNATGLDFGQTQATSETVGEHDSPTTHGYTRFLSIDPWESSIDDEVPIGIPFNALRYDRPPRVLVMAHERAWPPADANGTTPRYFWDCAFRRLADRRVQVAVFVYRAKRTSLSEAPWRPQPMLDENDMPVLSVPHRLRIRDIAGSSWPGWAAGLVGDEDVLYSDASLFGLPGLPQVTTDIGALSAGWQHPRQWLLDQAGSVHRVIAGRSNDGDTDPVVLSSPIPEPTVVAARTAQGGGYAGDSMNFSAAQHIPAQSLCFGRSAWDWSRGVLRPYDFNDIDGDETIALEPWTPFSNYANGDPPAVGTIWYIPPVVRTSTGVTYELEPVYVVVEDL